MFVLPLLGHPRHAKRIAMIQEAGFEVSALAFEREYHKGKLPDCPVRTLGKIENGKYVARAFKIARALPGIRKSIKQSDLVYAFGPDLAMASLFAGLGTGKPVTVEVGDIDGLQVRKGMVGRFVRFLNSRMARACKLIVVTAPRFLEVYYREWLKSKTPGMVVENKLESEFVETFRPQVARLKPMPGDPLVDRPLRIGYFGLLYDEWTWLVFEQLARSYPDKVEILYRGIPYHTMRDLPERIAPYKNMHYRGEYKSPVDLPELYGSVDLVWACYDPIRPDDWNLKWARPNRFYESCFFQRPLVTRSGCQDSEDVEKYRIGMIMSEVDPAKAADAVVNILPVDLQKWSENMSRLPLHVFAYTDESVELGKTIAGLIEKSRS